MIKKFLSALCFLVIAANMLVVPITSAAIGDKAVVDFSGGSPETTNVSSVMLTEGGNDYVDRDGRGGIRMLPKKGGEFIRLNLDDKVFQKEPKGKPTLVTIDYFDEGTGYFTLRYDSVSNNVLGIMEDHADIVRMTDSKTWKTHTFYMEDAAYGGTWQWTDINVALFSTVGESLSNDNIIIGRIEVEKCFPRNPITRNLTSAHTGNIFGGDEEKKIAWDFENITELELEMKIEWAVYDEYGNRLQTESYEKTFAPEEKSTYEWSPKAEDYGIYKVSEITTVNYEENGEQKTVVSSNVYDFSIINKFTEGEEKNDKIVACTHIVQLTCDKYKTTEIASQAGFSRLRDELRWSAVEETKGTYDFSGDKDFPLVIDENSMKFHYIAAFGNRNYASCLDENGKFTEGRIPTSEDDINAFVDYMMAVLDKYHDQIDSVELWNEPNHASFNGGNDSETAMGIYTNLVKACYPAIKAKYPEIKVAIFGMAGVDIPNITRCMELGIYDYCDAVAVHPYQWNGQFVQSAYIDDLKRLQEVMTKYGNGNVKEIWLTEMGFTSGNACKAGVTPEEQAIYMVQLYTLAMGQGLADRVYWYNLQNKGTQIGVQESNFGLIGNQVDRKSEVESIYDVPDFTAPNTAWSAKRSYVAAAEMNKLLAQAEIEKIPDVGEGSQAYQFLKKNGERVNVVWSDKNAAENVSFKVNGNARVLDMYGNVLGEMNGDNDTFTVTLGDRPVYIDGNYEKFEVAETEITCSGSDMTIANGDRFNIAFADNEGRNLKLQAEPTDAFAVLENTGTLENGKGTITLVTAENASVGKQKINVKFYNEDVLVGNTDIYVNIIEPIKMSIEEKRNQNSLDRYIANVTITNMSEISNYNGDLKITEPEELAENSSVAHFTSLKPGESITIPLSMPRTIEKKYYDLKIVTDLNIGKSVSIDKSIRLESQKSRLMNGNVILMEKVKNQPVIDGTLSEGEWTQEAIVVNNADQYYKLDGDWEGPEDASFKAWTAWDDNYFYLAVEVEDNVFSNNESSSNLWAGDSIQFGIVNGEPDHLASTSYCEYGMALLKDGPALYRFLSISDYLQIGDVENVELTIRNEGTKTYYEMKLPWSETIDKDFKPSEGSSLSFSIIMNDNDGDYRKGYIAYTDGIGTTKSAALFNCFDFAE